MNIHRAAILLGAVVGQKQRLAMLFQSVVLPCQYQTSSIQSPVVQWWYKSYCQDRTQESFTLTASQAKQASHLECADSRRTVRVVASLQGASTTLADHYKGRDIAIINKADLRIGELQWGDSGVYFCKVVIADDFEGKNEAHLELLVLGRTGQQDDILPEFDVEIMPEWVFVGCVVLGSVLFLLLVGICWCQCCPHNCCCYISCCCCPETCCCPRQLYEAGKLAKRCHPAQVPVYPYYIPLAPLSHVDPKISSATSLDNNLAGVRSGYRSNTSRDQDSMNVHYNIEKEMGHYPSAKMTALQTGSQSELSSLHDGGNTDFRHTYQTVQMDTLPPIADTDDRSVLRTAPTRRRPRWDRDSHSEDELDRRCNPRSEHMQRRTLGRRGRTGSLDELEEFARSYGSCGRRAEAPDRLYVRDYSPPRRFYRDEEDGWSRRSPSPVLQKRRDTWDSDRPSQPSHSSGYDDAFLRSVMERKAREGGRGARRVDEDSDTPSKGSTRGKGSSSYYSRSPSNRPEEEPLPPYSEKEAERHRRAGPDAGRYRTVEPPRTEPYRSSEAGMKSFSYTRPEQGMPHTLQGGRDDWDRNRNLSTALSRDPLTL